MSKLRWSVCALAFATGALGAASAWGQSPAGSASVSATPVPAPAAAPAPPPSTSPPETPVPSARAPATEPSPPADLPPAEKTATVAPILSPTPPSASTADPSEPEDATTPGWFRVDSDHAGLSLWVGATHGLGGVGLATDVVVSSGAYSDIASGDVFPFSLAQFDIGPAFAFVDGAVALTPMVGIQFDWYRRRTVALSAPQLFTTLAFGPLYFESWVQCFFYGLFAEEARIRDNLTTRNFLLYKLGDAFAVGPNVEVTYLFESRSVFSLPVGGAAMLNYGKNSTLLLSLGYETDADARASSGGSGERSVAGRFTFIQTW